jgi:uncharacterized protein YcbK (DUF882 family)
MHAWLAAAILLSALPTPPPKPAGEPSKKQAFLQDKHERTPVHLARVLARAAAPVLTVHNVWTEETLPVLLETTPKGIVPEPASPFDQLARDHFTNQSTKMDARLFETLVRAAEKFHARYVEVVSGFRAPKYQLMLRKKGHEVARDSQHPRGTAVDFRVAGVPTKILLRFVRSLHLGGVGYYPESKFVHADVGRIRFWRGH